MKQIFPTHLLEVEGALPGRFFDRTTTFADRHLGPDGHFLTVNCLGDGGRETPCPDKQAVLEERILEISVLKSLPCQDPGTSLYDEITWEATTAGRDALKRLQAGFPKLWKTLIATAIDSLKKR